MSRRTRIGATIKRAQRQAQQRFRREEADIERELERIYRQAQGEIEAKIASRGGPDGRLVPENLHSLRAELRERIAKLGRERDDLFEAGLRRGAEIGTEAFTELDANLSSIAEEAVEFVRNFVDEDGLQISDRIWRNNRQARETIEDALEQAIVQGQSASQAIQRLREQGQDVPSNLERKLESARAERVGRRAASGLFNTDDGQGRSPHENARRLFRTEINRAHGVASREAAFEHPEVIGTRFLLSPNHPRPDQCDMHASANLYGMGPGVYPKGKSPWPAHPNTLSFEEPVFSDEIEDEDREREDRISWLQQQPRQIQERVLDSRAKAAALREGILKQNEIRTPWRVLKERYKQRGIDITRLTGG